MTFHINTHKCKRETVKILSTWQTDMLCRKTLLSGSAAKASLQPNAVWCQKSLKHFFPPSACCTGHTPRRAPRSASASEILAHLDHWHIQFHWVMMGSIWAQLYPFSSSTVVDYFHGEPLPERTWSFLAKTQRSYLPAQIRIRNLPSTGRLLAGWWGFKALLKGPIKAFNGELLFLSFSFFRYQSTAPHCSHNSE